MSAAIRILSYLQDRRDEMVNFLERLANVESPSEDGATHAPAFAVFAEALWDLDFVTRELPGRNSGGQLYARPRERRRGQPLQLLIGHIDTVWPQGTLKKMPVRLEQGRLRGPGVYDMKGGLTQLIFALEALRVLGLAASVLPLVFVNSDEETGSAESTVWIGRLARIANRAYVLEPALGREGRLKTARKGIGRFTATIRDQQAHAGAGAATAVNTILELSHQVQCLFALNDPLAGVAVNVTMIDSGLGPGGGVSESRCGIEVRVPTREAARRIDSCLRALAPLKPGMHLRVTGGFERPPMERTEAGTALWEVAHAIGLELGMDLQQAAAGGSSDGNTTSQYTATLDGLGAVGDGAHAHHEFLFVDRLVERAALLALLILAPPIETLNCPELTSVS